MIIYFTTIEETQPKYKYCVQYEENDGVIKQTLFGVKQKRMLLEYLSKKLDDNSIINIKIRKYEK